MNLISNFDILCHFNVAPCEEVKSILKRGYFPPISLDKLGHASNLLAKPNYIQIIMNGFDITQ